MSEDKILIEVEFDDDDAGKRLAEIKQRMAELAAEQKTLKKEIEKGNDTTGQMARKFAENAAEVNNLKTAEKDLTAVIQSSAKTSEKYGDSLNAMSAQLAQMKREYRSLSKEAREGEVGQAMLKDIAGLDEKMKEADASMGDFQRNVGNYSSAMKGLDGRVVAVASVFENGFTNGLRTAGASVKSFSKTLLTTPIGWIMTAVQLLIAVFNQLKAAFQRNDESSDSLKEAFSALQPLITGVRKIFDALAKTIGAVAQGFSKVAKFLAEKLSPAYKQAADEAYALEKAEQALDDRSNAYTVNSAKRAVEIAKRNRDIRTNERLTAEQRERMAKEAIDLERRDMEEQREIAAERLRIYEARISQEVKMTDEEEKKLAQLRAEAYKAEESYITGTLRLAQQEKTAREDQRKAAQEAYKARVAAAKEAAKVEREELRKLQDLIIGMNENAIGAIRVSYQRQIEDLRRRLVEERNLTTAARKYINGQIEALERKMNDEIAGLQEAAAKERLAAEIEAVESLNAARLEAMSDGAAKEAAAENAALQKRLAALQKRLDEEKTLTAVARAAILEEMEVAEEQSQERIAQIRAKWRAKELQDIWNETAARAANDLKELELRVGGGTADALAAQLAAAQEAYDRLMAMDDESKAALFANGEAYRSATLDAMAAVQAAQKAMADSQMAQLSNFKSAIGDLGGSLSELFGEIAGDTEELAVFNKAIALVNATLAMAEAIAKATAAASAGDPYTLAIRIAAAGVAVAANFASLIATIKSAAVPAAPTFASGGIVPGSSVTGDKVVARVNSREMVLTLDDQRRLLELIRSGVPVSDGDRLAAALTEALRSMPAPVLEYRTFERFAKNAKMRQNRARIR